MSTVKFKACVIKKKTKKVNILTRNRIGFNSVLDADFISFRNEHNTRVTFQIGQRFSWRTLKRELMQEPGGD